MDADLFQKRQVFPLDALPDLFLGYKWEELGLAGS
jgi:hypothetical protein